MKGFKEQLKEIDETITASLDPITFISMECEHLTDYKEIERRIKGLLRVQAEEIFKEIELHRRVGTSKVIIEDFQKIKDSFLGGGK